MSPPIAPASPRPFTVFLDRDGVFDIHTFPAVLSWRWFRWLPGVREAFARLNQPHIRTCLATNQPFVGVRVLPRRRLDAIHARMMMELEQAGGRLHRIEAATAPAFLPNRRRKPQPGMLEDGARGLEAGGWTVDKARAVMVGDRVKDAQAAAAFGIQAILLATTDPRDVLERKMSKAGLRNAVVASGLPEAVEIILQRAAA